MGNKISRRGFSKVLAGGILGFAMSPEAALPEGKYKDGIKEKPYKGLEKNDPVTPPSQLAVLDIGYQGPAFSDYHNQPLMLRYLLEEKLDDLGIPLIDSGVVLDELDRRGISFERFLQRPGEMARLDPISSVIRNTDVIIGMCNDFDDYYRRNDHPNNLRSDVIRVKYIDLETGRVLKTFKDRGKFEIGQEEKMMKYIAEDISGLFNSLQ